MEVYTKKLLFFKETHNVLTLLSSNINIIRRQDYWTRAQHQE